MKDYAKIDTSDKKPLNEIAMECFVMTGIMITGFALFAWAVA